MGGYMSEVLNYETDLHLGRTEMDFLQRFARGKASAYNIYSERGSEPYHTLDQSLRTSTMAYKNVHKRVKRLVELGLIHEVTNRSFEERQHNAKDYGITDKGIFYVIYFRFHSLGLYLAGSGP